jgi:hypothetical protein
MITRVTFIINGELIGYATELNVSGYTTCKRIDYPDDNGFVEVVFNDDTSKVYGGIPFVYEYKLVE